MKGNAIALKKLGFVACLFALAVDLPGQGTFQNLDFEQAMVADLLPTQIESVSITNGLPGWAGYLGADQQNMIHHNGQALALAEISILGPTYPLGVPAIQGRYSVWLKAGDYITTLNHVRATIAQTGLVPANAQSIRLKTGPYEADFSIELGGKAIPMSLLSVTSTYYLYGGSIAPFAGQSAELRISALPIRHPVFSQLTLDDLMFSPEAIPEPSGLGLLSAGFLLLCWRVWRITA